MIVILAKSAIYFNAETQSRRVRRGSLRSGVRSRSSELELESGVGERSWRWSGSPSERIRRIRRGSARRSFRTPTTSEISAKRSWRQKRRSEAGEPTGAREHVCGPSVILTASVKGAREGARVKIMLVGRPQTAGRASRSGAGLAFGRRQRASRRYYFFPPLNAEEPERARR